MLLAAAALGDYPPELRKVAKNQLGGDGLLLHLIKQLLDRQSTFEKKLSVQDLTTDEGRLKAIGLQGDVRGLKTAINVALEMGEEEFTQND